MPGFIMLFMYFYNYWFSHSLTSPCFLRPSRIITSTAVSAPINPVNWRLFVRGVRTKPVY